MTTDTTTKPAPAMSAKAAYPLKLPHSIKNAAQRSGWRQLMAYHSINLLPWLWPKKLARLKAPKCS